MTYASEVLADSPRGYWRLGDRGAGLVAADSASGGGSPLTYSGGVAAAAGLLTADSNGAARFDEGSVAEGTTAAAIYNISGTFALEAWVQFDALDHYETQMIVHQVSSSEAIAPWRIALMWYPSNSQLILSYRDLNEINRELRVSNTGIEVGVRAHIVGVVDGSTMAIYVNGVQKGAQAKTGSPMPTAASSPLVIGGSMGGTNWSAKAVIDEVAVYSTLTPARIAAHYAAGTSAGPPPPGAPVAITGSPQSATFRANLGALVVTEPPGAPLAIAGTAQAFTLEAGSGIIRQPPELALTILDDQMRQAPSSLQITLGGAMPGDTVTFSVDGVEVWEETADAEGELGQTSIPIPEAQGAKGAHVLSVDSTTGSDSADFTILRAPAAIPANQSVDAPAVFIPGSTGRWVFQDVMPGGLGSWVMPVNPKTMSNPHGARSFEAEHTTGRSGQFHVSEAEQLATPWKIAGYCPDEPFQDQLKAYAELERRFYLIDHRGRAWKVAVQDLTIEQRKRQSDDVDPDNDWSSNWSMDLVIYNKSWAVVSE